MQANSTSDAESDRNSDIEGGLRRVFQAERSLIDFQAKARPASVKGRQTKVIEFLPGFIASAMQVPQALAA